jgi:hypothetical protein
VLFHFFIDLLLPCCLLGRVLLPVSFCCCCCMGEALTLLLLLLVHLLLPQI